MPPRGTHEQPPPIDTEDAPRGPEGALSDVAADLLIEAGAVLATSLDPATTMDQVARLTVPRLADLCIIDLLEQDGSVKGVGIAAAEEAMGARLRQLREQHPIEAASAHPVAEAIRSGEPRLLSELDEDQLRRFASHPQHAQFMIDARCSSAIVAPLTARNRILGAISLLRCGQGARYSRSDLTLTVELACRAALAIDNARLYSDLRSLERRLEAILVELAEAVTVVDRDGATIFANRAAERLLGLGSGQSIAHQQNPALRQRAEGGSVLQHSPKGQAPFETQGEAEARSLTMFDEAGGQLALQDMPASRLLRGGRPAPLIMRAVKDGGEERWLIVRASPVADPDSGQIAFAVNVFEDITELKRAEIAESFLADTSTALSSSLDDHEVLRTIVELAVPRIADLCFVTSRDARGELAARALRHVDPGRSSIARRLADAWCAQAGEEGPLAEVSRTGQPVRLTCRQETIGDQGSAAADAALLRELRLDSTVIVPMSAAGRTIGAIVLGSEQGRRRLSPADLSLAVELGRRAGVALENARLYTERARIATALQQALLPEALPHIPGAELAARYAAAGELNEVGGDFYDVFQHFDGRWVLAIGDVCGKGPRAAAVTALVRHTLRAAAMSGQAPRVLLMSVHQALMSQPAGLDMCTAGLILADVRPPEAHLTIVLAGHPHPLLVKPDGSVVRVGRPGTLLGVIDPPSIEQDEVRLRPGETIVLYTDGVSEAGAPGRQLGESGLLEICAQAPRLSLHELLTSIERAAIERTRGAARDDIALLALRLRAQGQQRQGVAGMGNEALEIAVSRDGGS